MQHLKQNSFSLPTKESGENKTEECESQLILKHVDPDRFVQVETVLKRARAEEQVRLHICLHLKAFYNHLKIPERPP